MKLTETDKAAWLAVGLEPEFMVWGPDQNDEGRWFDVVDAECIVVATCKTREHADAIAKALTFFNDAIWRVED